MRTMPAMVRGPMAGAVMERFSAWLVTEGYARTMVPQVLGVARGLSAWMDDHDVALEALTVDDLGAFEAVFAPGVAGHVLVGMRMPVVRRFLVEAGCLRDAPVVRKRTRRPRSDSLLQVGEAVNRELDEWGRWQLEVRGIGEACVRHRRLWVAELVDSLPGADGGSVDWGCCDVAMLNSFITRRSAGLSASSCTMIVDATRSLMRWALASGRVERDLFQLKCRSFGV